MSSGGHGQKVFFCRQVRSQHDREQYRQGDQGEPDGVYPEMHAEESGGRRAQRKAQEHGTMGAGLFHGIGVFLPAEQDPAQVGAQHTGVIGAEGGGGADAFGLTEGVVLHGADEIDDDLADLMGGRGGDEAHHDDCHDLNQHQQGIPAQPELPHVAGQDFGHHAAQQIAHHGNQKIQGFTPVAGTDGDGLSCSDHVAIMHYSLG